MATKNRLLRKNTNQEQISGVCAGIAEYLDLDVTLVRVIFVVLIFVTGGAMIIFYIILAFIIPDSEDSSTDNLDISEKAQKIGKGIKNSRGVHNLRNYFGLGLLIIGSWLLLVQIFPEWALFRWDFVWPVVLIVTGCLIIFKRR